MASIHSDARCRLKLPKRMFDQGVRVFRRRTTSLLRNYIWNFQISKVPSGLTGEAVFKGGPNTHFLVASANFGFGNMSRDMCSISIFKEELNASLVGGFRNSLHPNRRSLSTQTAKMNVRSKNMCFLETPLWLFACSSVQKQMIFKNSQ